ncbi:MAG: PEP-CTERM sorting domain-containing protein [Chthoniobacterales bacterium]
MKPSFPLKPLFATFLSASLLLSVSMLHAADFTWTGAVSTDFDAPGNWTPGGYTHRSNVIFDSLTANQPGLDSNEDVSGLTFNTAGWTISSNGNTLRFFSVVTVTSNGVGTNTVESVATNASTASINYAIGAGNTLDLGTITGTNKLSVTSKTGDGTLIIGASPTATVRLLDQTIAGTLILNADVNDNQFGKEVIVGNAAVFGGTGTISEGNRATYTVASGGTLAPGSIGLGDSSAGTQTFSNIATGTFRDIFVTLESGSKLALDIFGDGSSDSVTLLGNDFEISNDISLTIESGVTLALAGTMAAGLDYTVATFTDGAVGDSTYTGVFDSVSFNGMTLGTSDYTFTYGTDAITIRFNVIPEPSTSLLLLGGLGAFLLRRKSRDNS